MNENVMWKSFEPTLNHKYEWCIGHHRIVFQKKENKWLIGHQKVDKSLKERFFETSDEKFINLQQYITDANEISIFPSLPDLPVIVKQPENINLLPGQTTKIYISVPVWIEICLGKNKTERILDIPSRDISNTWNGDQLSGELCYSLYDAVYQKNRIEEIDPLNAICTIAVTNDTENVADLSKFAIDIEYLSLFISGNTLVTDRLNANINSEDQSIILKLSGELPADFQKAELIKEPNKMLEKGIVKKSFKFIKSLYR